jgi:hypothetical protein
MVNALMGLFGAGQLPVLISLIVNKSGNSGLVGIIVAACVGVALEMGLTLLVNDQYGKEAN